MSELVQSLRLLYRTHPIVMSAADEIERQAKEIERLKIDAERYRRLRAGNAYAPEENGIRGGEALDELCDKMERHNA